MNRFQKLVGATLALTLALVIVGVVVRATGSGLGCPDWPFCYGQLVPPLGDFSAWAEWTHRLIAAVIGLLVAGVAVLALIDHRDRPTILFPSIGAVALVGFQAWLGRETVRLGNSGPSVTAHLATALALVGLLGDKQKDIRFGDRDKAGRLAGQRSLRVRADHDARERVGDRPAEPG